MMTDTEKMATMTRLERELMLDRAAGLWFTILSGHWIRMTWGQIIRDDLFGDHQRLCVSVDRPPKGSFPNGTPLANYRFYLRKVWELLDAHG